MNLLPMIDLPLLYGLLAFVIVIMEDKSDDLTAIRQFVAVGLVLLAMTCGAIVQAISSEIKVNINSHNIEEVEPDNTDPVKMIGIEYVKR